MANLKKTSIDKWERITNDYVLGYIITDPETFEKTHKYPTLDELVEKYGIKVMASK
jgi:hypothetical protein